MVSKRPRLIPIVDKVVLQAVNAPSGSYWDMFRAYLGEPTRRQAYALYPPSELDPRVALLRVLDVAIWMRGSNDEDAQEIRAKLGLAD